MKGKTLDAILKANPLMVLIHTDEQPWINAAEEEVQRSTFALVDGFVPGVPSTLNDPGEADSFADVRIFVSTLDFDMVQPGSRQEFFELLPPHPMHADLVEVATKQAMQEMD